MNSSKNIVRLINELSELPGIGKKSAARLAYYLIDVGKEKVDSLLNAITVATKNVKHCKVCNTLSDEEICNICANQNRNHKIIMVVENERDLQAYENIGEYKGVYHVLGGAISPLIGIGPNELKIKELIERLKDDVEEVIIATNSSIEGETTASYLIKMIRTFNIKITKIAQGVPVGGDIENIDELTLKKALSGRVEV